MRIVVELLVVLFVGLGLGGVISWQTLRENQGFGAVNVGPWTAWPKAGSAEADPYTDARVAADGDVPLGAAEGISFTAETSGDGQILRRQCAYRLSGKLPSSGFWAVTATGVSGEALLDRTGNPSALTSALASYGSDGSIDIIARSELSSGNWLPVEGSGPFLLNMRLYDTPVTSMSTVIELQMPDITLIGCKT